jgi:hypothetical protein
VSKSSGTEITYTPRPDAAPEAELDALASVYRFILDFHTKKKANKLTPEPVGRDDVKELDGYAVIRHHNK